MTYPTSYAHPLYLNERFIMGKGHKNLSNPATPVKWRHLDIDQRDRYGFPAWGEFLVHNGAIIFPVYVPNKVGDVTMSARCTPSFPAGQSARFYRMIHPDEKTYSTCRIIIDPGFVLVIQQADGCEIRIPLKA
jgi:hypothetical protein